MSGEEFDWDADDFDPDAGFAKNGDQWDDEDQDLQLAQQKELEVVEEKEVHKVPKKSKKEIMEEKKKKRKVEEAKKLEKEKESLTKGAQREADLGLAKELFEPDSSSTNVTIDSMTVVTQDDFDQLGDALKEKLNPLTTSPYFLAFMDNLLRDSCTGMDVEEMRKLGSTMNFMANEKQKAAKPTKGKKKKKAALGMTGKLSKKADMNIFDNYDNDADYGNDADFM